MVDDATSFALAAIENMVREDLSPVEEARSVAVLCDVNGLSKAEIARRAGRTREAISSLVRLLELPRDVLDLIESGQLSEGHGRALLLCSEQRERRRLARRAVAGGGRSVGLERQARGELASSTTGSLHPDQLAFAGGLGDTLGRALGRDVEVAPGPDGYRVILQVRDPDDAADLLARVGALAPSFSGGWLLRSAVDPTWVSPQGKTIQQLAPVPALIRGRASSLVSVLAGLAWGAMASGTRGNVCSVVAMEAYPIRARAHRLCSHANDAPFADSFGSRRSRIVLISGWLRRRWELPGRWPRRHLDAGAERERD